MSRPIKIFLVIILSSGLGFSCGQKQVDKNSDIPPIDMADFDAQTDIQKGDIHLISYGLTIPFPQQDSLTKKYGFYFQNRGCLASDTTDKLAEIYNKKIIEYLSKRNGKDWYKKFQLVADSLDEEMMKHLSDSTK